MKRQYGDDTFTVLEDGPFACGFTGARAICEDGKVRNCHPTTDGIADTFFSVPMFVYVGRKRVYGYITMETRDGYDTESTEDPIVVKFVAYNYCKHHELVGG